MGFFTDLDQADTEAEAAPSGSPTKGFFSDLPKEVGRARSLLSAFPKGVLKSTKGIQSFHDPVGSTLSKLFGNNPQEQQEEEVLQQHLPTKDGFLEGALETAGKEAPMFLMGPESLALKGMQLGAGALGKQVSKEMGAPELVQDLVGAATSLTPQGVRGAFANKIAPTAAKQEVYDILKKQGLTDKQIVPFIQSEKRVERLASWSKPFIGKKGLEKEIKPIQSILYENVDQKAVSLPPLEGAKRSHFLKVLDDSWNKIHYKYRAKMQSDIDRLKSSPLAWKDLDDFYKAVNIEVGDMQGGKAVLGKLKDPINMGQRMLSKDLFKEKRLADKVYESGQHFLESINPDQIESIVSKNEALAALAGLGTGFLFVPKGIAIKKGMEYALSKFLTSPRYQGMSKKLWNALKKDNQSEAFNISIKMLEDLDKFIVTDEGTQEENKQK